jgi:26S proteasome regulatory subunit N8
MPPITTAVVHPLVLLSTVDHFYRAAKDTNKRVVGVLLGEVSRGRVEITNSYAVPFEEDDRNPKVWFLDHNYHENMFAMFKKVNAREGVVGWYSTGPKLKENDLEIHEVVRRYCPNPVLVVIDVQLKEELEIPTKSYLTVEEVAEDGTTKMRFQHITSEIGALEAEEVGVEHLLRDVKDSTVSSLAHRVNNKLLSLRSLESKIGEIEAYLQNVAAGKLPINNNIINQIQDMFNLMPNLNQEELVRSFTVKTNDQMQAIYLSSLIRAVIALHNLIRNKLALREAERKADQPKEKKDEKKEGEKKEGEKEGEKKEGDKKDEKGDKAGEKKDAKDTKK